MVISILFSFLLILLHHTFFFFFSLFCKFWQIFFLKCKQDMQLAFLLIPSPWGCSETSQCKISMKVKPLCLGNKYECFLLLTGHCFSDELGCHSGWHTVGWYVAAQPLRRCFKWMFVMRRCGFTDLNSQTTFN